MGKILFKEVQYFRQNPVWTILLMIPIAVFGSILVYQLATGTGVGERPWTNTSLAILGIGILIPSLLAALRIKLTTIIDEDKIAFGWNMPTPELIEIKLSDIKEWSVIKHDFVGYGYRKSEKYGTVHNLIGNRGLFIVTKNGEKVLIGTHRLRDLKTLMESLPVPVSRIEN
jgi:hypothetical protein